MRHCASPRQRLTSIEAGQHVTRSQPNLGLSWSRQYGLRVLISGSPANPIVSRPGRGMLAPRFGWRQHAVSGCYLSLRTTLTKRISGRRPSFFPDGVIRNAAGRRVAEWRWAYATGLNGELEVPRFIGIRLA